MIKRKDRLYKFFMYTVLILATNPVSSHPKLQGDQAAIDYFANMLSSIIKINEKRVRSINTLINLDDLYRAKSSLRNGRTNTYSKEPKIKSNLIAVIIGNNENIKRQREKLNFNDLLTHENSKSKASLANSNEIWRPTRRDFDSDDSSSEYCDGSDKTKCRIIAKYSSREGSRSCRRRCRRGCKRACISAFRNFCLSYTCDYSMKTKIEKNCKRACVYKFRDRD